MAFIITLLYGGVVSAVLLVAPNGAGKFIVILPLFVLSLKFGCGSFLSDGKIGWCIHNEILLAIFCAGCIFLIFWIISKIIFFLFSIISKIIFFMRKDK
jgi:hypothetical protein